MRALFLSLLLTACGTTVPDDAHPDLQSLPACPAGVDDALHPVACDGSKDTQCWAPLSGIPQGQVCNCLCGRKWECDAIFAYCDGGIDLGAHD